MEFEVKIIMGWKQVAIPLCARMRKLALTFKFSVLKISIPWIDEWTKRGNDLTLNIKRQTDLGRLITDGDKKACVF